MLFKMNPVKYRGFTVVELMIVIIVMGILLTIGIVNFKGQQARARDTERTAKVENIARYLESMRATGNPSPLVEPGTYPRASTIANSCTSNCTTASPTPWAINQANLKNLFSIDNFDLKNLKTPGATDFSLVVSSSPNAPDPAPTTSTIVYQPIKNTSSGYAVCNLSADECSAFVLYYRLEFDNSVQKVESKYK